MLTRQNTSVLFLIVLFAVLTTVQSVRLPSVSEAAINTADGDLIEGSTFTEALKDEVISENAGRKKRAVRSNRKMNHNNLTYRIMSYPSENNHDNIDIEIARAFALWSNVTNLSFKIKRFGAPDIEIRFTNMNNGLSKTSDTRNGKTIEFNSKQNWNVLGECGYNLFQVAAHKIGHILGLPKNDATSSIMNPEYNFNNPILKLSKTDIEDIQKSYGRRDH